MGPAYIVFQLKLTISAIRNYFNISVEPLEIYSLSRVRAVIRGYRIMQTSDNKNLAHILIEEITTAKIKFNRDRISNYVLPYKKEVVELSYRQYLLSSLIGTRLNASVLAHLSDRKPIVFPLPIEWIKVLQKNNLKVAVAKSRFIFFLFALSKFSLAIVQYLRFSASNLIYQFERKKPAKNEYIYLMGLKPDCLPPADGSFRYNIIEWYLNWPGKEEDVKEIRHNIKTRGQLHKNILINYSSEIPKIDSIYNFLLFVVWGCLSLISSFFCLLTGRLTDPVFLSEIQKAKIFSLADKSSIGKNYMFNYQNIIYRPLWTYPAEVQGAKITYYNWVSSFSDFLGPEGYKPSQLGEKILNWPYILQWSSTYTDYLRSIIESKNTKFKLVSPIYFSDSTLITYKSKRPLIVVFDVAPQKKYFHDILIPFVEYRTFPIGKQFVQDIYEKAIENGFDILWKTKQDFNYSHSKAYIRFCDKFMTLPGVIAADPAISAFRLVQEANGVITMPFTSTAFVAESFKKPSVFYDPSNLLFKEDRGRLSIPLLSGKEELDKWMRSLEK